MNSRERFHETFRYGSPDRVFLMSQWTFHDTRQRWLREGMPWDVHFDAYFGFSPMVDHAVPPDVSFANFKYYVDLVQEICTFN